MLSVAGLAGVVLAVVGGAGSGWARLSNALELLYPHFPGAAPPGTSWMLMVARVLLPLIALYATVRFLVSFYSTRIRLARLRRARGHAVVYGLSAAGLRAARTLAASHKRVIAVEREVARSEVQSALDAGVTVLAARTTPATLLRAANVASASQLVCATDDDAENVRSALHARSESPAHTLAIFARVGRRELVELLDDADVECFDLYELWARNMLEQSALARVAPDAPAPRIVIVGAGPLARATLENTTRLWHFFARETHVTDHLRLTLVAPDAEAVVAAVTRDNAAVSRTTRLDAVAWDIASSLDPRGLVGADAPTSILLCVGDAALNMALARLATRDLAAHPAVEILVGAENADDHAARLIRGSGVDALTPRLVIVAPEHDDGFRFDRFSRREEVARSLHTVYVNQARRDAGRPATAIAAFDDLPDADKQANRDQAGDIPRQLVAALCRLAPIADWDELCDLTSSEIEVMALLEHVRWTAGRVDAGWQYGPTRDATRRTHPDLVAWDALSEPTRELNRAFVRARPALLGRVGQAIERDPVREQIARAVHDRYRSGVAPAATSWEGLPDPARGTSRAFAAALPLMLVRAGYAITPAPASVPTGFADAATVERLAADAHAVWAGDRLGDGWVWGPTRGDARREHPDIVAWSDLADDRREIDRMLVRAIPAILAEAGRGMTMITTAPLIAAAAGAASASAPNAGDPSAVFERGANSMVPGSVRDD